MDSIIFKCINLTKILPFKNFLFLIFIYNLGIPALYSQVKLDSVYTYDELNNILELARQNKDQVTLGKTYFLMANFQAEKFANYDNAIEYYTRAKQYFQISGDSTNFYKTQYAIAKRYMEAGFLTESYKLYSTILESKFIKNDPKQNAWMLFEMSRLSKLRGDEYQSLQYLNQAIIINSTVQDTVLMTRLSFEKINTLIELLEIDSALVLAFNTFKLSNEHNNLDEIAESLFYIGYLNKLKLDYDKAIKYLTKSENIYHYKAYDEKRKKLYFELSESYAQSGNYKSAFEYINKYTLLNDSILNKSRIESISNLALKYGTKEKESSIKVLEIDKQYAEEKNKKQKRILYALTIGLFVVLTFIYFLIRFYNQRIASTNIINEQKEEINKRKIKELEDNIKITSMQSVIEGQEIERERIAKELHDSLGGLLSTIKLQFDNSKFNLDNNFNYTAFHRAHELLDTAVEEVRTISRNLQPGSLKKLGLVAAIKDLINRFESLQSPEIYFQYYEVPQIMDKMVSLTVYRILQELLTNSLKHANAKEILIQLNTEDDELVIQYEDDGIGFDQSNIYKKGMGLENIKSRINYLHGSLSLDSNHNEGLSVLIRVKYKFDL